MTSYQKPQSKLRCVIIERKSTHSTNLNNSTPFNLPMSPNQILQFLAIPIQQTPMTQQTHPPYFSVRRRKPELLLPEKQNPLEINELSDVDDQEALHYQISFIMLYRNSNNTSTKDPVNDIRKALSKALVYYYPLAGRLKEGPNGKLVVDCSGELGVLFTEADADVSLQQLGGSIQPPCPYLGQFLYSIPNSDKLLGSPLLLIQVTRLSCGGFVFAIRWSHTVADATGIFKFLYTIAEFSRGATKPSLIPKWRRELLNARSPPQVTSEHHEFDEVTNTISDTDTINMVHKSFFFGQKEIDAIQQQIPIEIAKSSSTFEVLAAYLWRARTIAMKLDPYETVSASGKKGVKLPAGYYGNAFIFPVAITKAELLHKNPLEYAVNLLKEIKTRLNEEYIRSSIDNLVVKGRKQFRTVKDFVVADTRLIPFEEIDLGWGKGVYGGPAGVIANVSFFAKYKRFCDGGDGIVVQISLPVKAMERFQRELGLVFDVVEDSSMKSTKVISKL